LDGNGDIDYYCFVVALGLKGDIHDIIEVKFNDELKVLFQLHEYYHGGYKANMMAAVVLVASIRDKPAKADANMTGHHNQLFSRRSRWASFLDVDIKVDSCASCAERRRQKLSGITMDDRRCNACADFDYHTTNGSLDGSITQPNGFSYPKTVTDGSPSPSAGREVSKTFVAMPPVEHTYPWLTALLYFAFYNYHFRIHEQFLRRQPGQNRIRGGVMSSPGWKASEVEWYLKSGGIGGGLIRRVKSLSSQHPQTHPNQLNREL
jgi:hypothetical protein